MKSKTTQKRLISELRRIARDWWDKGPIHRDPDRVAITPFGHGICWELSPYRFSDYRTRFSLGEMYQAENVKTLFAVMINMYGRKNSLWLCPQGTKWDQRAMYALLIAEMLEQEMK